MKKPMKKLLTAVTAAALVFSCFLPAAGVDTTVSAQAAVYQETADGSGIFTNGKYKYYTTSDKQGNYYLVQKNLKTGKKIKLKKFKRTGLSDSPDSYTVTAVSGSNVYICRDSEKSWSYTTYTYNVKKGKVIKKTKKARITETIGKYAAVCQEKVTDVTPVKYTIYKMTVKGLKKVKTLGKYVRQVTAKNKKFYYAVYPASGNMNSVKIYRINKNGKKKTLLCSYSLASSTASVYVESYGSNSCVLSYSDNGEEGTVTIQYKTNTILSSTGSSSSQTSSGSTDSSASSGSTDSSTSSGSTDSSGSGTDTGSSDTGSSDTDSGSGSGDSDSDSDSGSAEDQDDDSSNGPGSDSSDGPGGDSSDGPGGDSSGGGTTDGDSSSLTYTAVNTYTEDTTVSNETITSTGTDENAVLVATEDITVLLDTVTIIRESDDSTGGDNASFYGVGASSLVTDGTLKIINSTITSNAAGGAGVFAYGDGVAYVKDTTITTKQDTSGGIHVAGGGTLYAWNLNVTTAGGSSAAIRSDRGSGTMVVDGGTYTSNGSGSPAIYCAADITVHDAVLEATASEAICIEGLNTIRLFDCDLTGNMADDSQNDCTWNVILYQSQSGDSEEGNSTFEMVGGTLTAKNGGMFYTTNTESTFILSGVTINNAEDAEFLFKCTGNSNERGWGSTGSNGADSVFTAIDQTLEGDVLWDTISQMDFYLTEGSTLTGAVLNDESQAGSGGSGYANVYIDESSTWIVTEDSMLTALYNAGTITDADGNPVTVLDTDGNVLVEGTSTYQITVSSYSTSADLSGASSVESWESYEKSWE